MAEEDSRTETEKQPKQGGYRTMPLILATEAGDRIASSGLMANLLSYLTQRMHMPLVEAAVAVAVVKACSSFTPIIGGSIADSFAGCFWTITGGSVFFLLGLILVTVSALIPSLHPPPCPANDNCQRATSSQLAVLYLAFTLTSIGSGGIRPCVTSFGADQFNHSGEKMEPRKKTFFNLYFIIMRISTAISLVVVIYVQENVGWGVGFSIPTLCMLVAIVIFVAGYSIYIKTKPQGSPFTRMAQVLVACWRKRNVAKPTAPSLLYENKELDAGISKTGVALHTDRLTFFDRAAVVTEGDKKSTGGPKPWRLSTVHRVEELKSIIRILPVWLVGILFIATASNNHSFAIHQGRTMVRRLSPHFEIPPATMSIFLDISTIVTLIFYSKVFVPIARRFTGNPSGITSLQRMWIGAVFSIIGYAVAALVEIKRKSVAVSHGLIDKPKETVPISVFWLSPQYCLYGIAESFLAVGLTEFLYDQAPESMRSIGVAMYWLTVALGNYLCSSIVSAISLVTKKQGEDWIQDNINRGKIDKYWWVMTGMEFLNFVYLIVCTKLYTYEKLKMLVVPEDKSSEI